MIRGAGAERVVRVSDLYKGPYITDLKPNELITEVRVPLKGFRGVYEFFRRVVHHSQALSSPLPIRKGRA